MGTAVTGITNGPFVAVASDARLAVVIRWRLPPAVVGEDTASGGWQRRQESASLCPFLNDGVVAQQEFNFVLGDEGGVSVFCDNCGAGRGSPVGGIQSIRGRFVSRKRHGMHYSVVRPIIRDSRRRCWSISPVFDHLPVFSTSFFAYFRFIGVLVFEGG